MGNTSTTKLTLEEKKAKKSEYNRNYRLANREKLLAYEKKYSRENKEKINKRNRSWYAKNKSKVANQRKTRYPLHKNKIASSNKKWSQENREARREIDKRYRDKHKDCPWYKIQTRLRASTYAAIYKKTKCGSVVLDMGCTAQEACDHLESLFDENMTWENAGSYWHVDHIFPLAKVDLENRVEFLAAVNWRNLQPLEAKANMTKGDKVTPAARRLFNKLVKEFSYST